MERSLPDERLISDLGEKYVLQGVEFFTIADLRQRLVVDPNLNSVLFFGARSGNGLWKSTNYGASWSKVSSFTDTGLFASLK